MMADLNKITSHNNVRIPPFLKLYFIYFLIFLFDQFSSSTTLNIKNSPNIPTFSNTTIVTAFFRLTSGHYRSSEDYNKWVGHMLTDVNDNLVVFTTPEEEEWLRSLRGNRPMILHLYKTIFDWPWVSRYKDEFLHHQRLLEDQKDVRANPYVYAIWNSKPSFVAFAAEKNEFGSEYFFWVDIGSRREHDFHFHMWPNEDRVMKVFEYNKNRMLFGITTPIDFYWNSMQKGAQYPTAGLQGTFFAGQRETVLRFNHTFTKYLDLFISMGSFVGLDQGVFSGISSIDAHKPDFMALDVRQVSCPVNNWFYFYHFFKNPEDGQALCEDEHSWPTADIIKWDRDTIYSEDFSSVK
jgi:hypothetical protein